MEKDNYIRIRVSSQFKKSLKNIASDNQTTLSHFVLDCIRANMPSEKISYDNNTRWTLERKHN